MVEQAMTRRAGPTYPQPDFFRSGDQLNDSSFQFVRQTLRGLSRNRLLRLRTSAYCSECHEVKRVTDFFAGSDIASLECGHRRPIFNRTPAERTAYDNAAAEHAGRRATGWQGSGSVVVTRVENVEAA